MPAKLQTVHVRVNDAATGKPTPCRVRFTDPDRNYFAPFGRLGAFATATGIGVGGNVLVNDEPWAYIDGACEIDLPPGEVRVQIWKGPEYRPLDETISLIAGKLSMRLTIERWARLSDEGWYSGDIRCHHLSSTAALLEAQAEDLAVVNVLITSARLNESSGGEQHWLGNVLEFSGQRPIVQSPGHLVVVNSYNRAPMGSLGLLNCHRVVYPLTVGRINWTLADWCGQCHRKGGLVVWSDVKAESTEPLASEGMANLLLGNVDALETTELSWCQRGHEAWYHLLNCGVRVPLAGGSGKGSNRVHLGRTRTYAKLGWGEEFDYKPWIEAVRAGRTFVSDGPLLWFSVEGREAGAVVDLAPGQERIKVRAQAKGLHDVQRLEIVAGGKVIGQASGSGGEASFEVEAPLTESTWLAARCISDGSPPFAAHTSPVYVRCADRPFRPDPASLDYVERRLAGYETMLRRFDDVPGFATAQDRERLEKVYVGALEALRRTRIG